MVKSGMGASILPSLSVENENCLIRKELDPKPVRILGLMYRKNEYKRNKQLRRLIEYIRQSFVNTAPFKWAFFCAACLPICQYGCGFLQKTGHLPRLGSVSPFRIFFPPPLKTQKAKQGNRLTAPLFCLFVLFFYTNTLKSVLLCASINSSHMATISSIESTAAVCGSSIAAW